MIRRLNQKFLFIKKKFESLKCIRATYKRKLDTFISVDNIVPISFFVFVFVNHSTKILSSQIKSKAKKTKITHSCLHWKRNKKEKQQQQQNEINSYNQLNSALCIFCNQTEWTKHWMNDNKTKRSMSILLVNRKKERKNENHFFLAFQPPYWPYFKISFIHSRNV